MITEYKYEHIVDDEVVGISKVVRQNMFTHIAEVHNQIFKWSPSICKQILSDFQEIFDGLAAEGVRGLVTYNDTVDKKLEKYWRMCGFEPMGEIFWDNTKYFYAIREL